MNKKILNLAVPNIISNLTIPLLGIVDLAVTGHLESGVYIGAIAIGTMIFNIIYSMFGFLRMGVTGLTAQVFGANNRNEIINNLLRGLSISLGAAFLLISLQIPIAKLAFLLIDTSYEVAHFAKEYFYIRIWAAPATISLYVFTGWFIGMQNTKIPMIIALIINSLNIFLNLFFVQIMGMKSDGVALGTVIAQYIGLGVAILFFVKKYSHYLKALIWKTVFLKEQFLHFIKVNKDIFVRTISLLVVFTFFTSSSASINDSVLAANTLLMQFLFIFSYLTDGFAYAAEALSGKYLGKQNFPKLKKLIKLSLIWGAILALFFTIIYAFFGNSLIALLTNQQAVIEVSEMYKIWIVLIPITSVWSFIWDGIFIGITASKQMKNSMLFAVILVFFPTWFLLNKTIGNHALWLAFILFLFTRGLAQSFIFIYSKYIFFVKIRQAN